MAKLPRDRNDELHVADLMQEFPFQGYIPHTEERGITLRQLARLISFAETRCHQWHSGSLACTLRMGVRVNVSSLAVHKARLGQVRPDVVCDGCGVTPVVGPCFKCTVCRDYHHCAECYNRSNELHPQHVFECSQMPSGT